MKVTNKTEDNKMNTNVMTVRALPWPPPICPISKIDHRNPAPQARSRVDLNLRATDPKKGSTTWQDTRTVAPTVPPHYYVYTLINRSKNIKWDGKYIPNRNCVHTRDDYNLKQ